MMFAIHLKLRLKRMHQHAVSRKISKALHRIKHGGHRNVHAAKDETIRRPSQDGEIERMYAMILDEMAIPESKRCQMMDSESLERKWQLIAAHSSSQVKIDDRDHTAAYWIDHVLKSNSMAMEELRRLQVVIRTSHRQVFNLIDLALLHV